MTYATSKTYTKASHDIAVDILLHYCDPWKAPMDIKEFTDLVAERVNRSDAVVLNKYLTVCNDGIVRVRKSHKELQEWRERYYSNVKDNWNALGISY